MIRVSEIVLPARIETRTDAYQCLYNEYHRASYIEFYGDVECEYDAQYEVYRVPVLKEIIENYTAAKAEDCARWGCE